MQLRPCLLNHLNYICLIKDSKIQVQQVQQVNNHQGFDIADVSLVDHGLDEPSDQANPSRNSNGSITTSQHSIGDYVLSPSTQSESLQNPSIPTPEYTASNFPSQPSQNVCRPTKTAPPIDIVVWKIHWQQLNFTCLMLISGLDLAIGHHVYYNSLSGTLAGDATRQALSIRFGTAFAFLVVACFKATTASALVQYVWTIVSRKDFTIGMQDYTFYQTLCFFRRVTENCHM